MVSTLLLGLDGATFKVLQPYCQDGTMPFLRAFMAEGAWGKMGSVLPPLTPCAWTSLATGRSPGAHGIFDFVRVTRHSGWLGCEMATSTDVRCDTIWSIASRFGQRVAALNFPVMFPPLAMNGWCVPGFVPWRHLRRAVHPPQFYEELSSLPGFDPKELVLDIEQERRAIQVLGSDEYEQWVQFHIRREERWLTVARYLVTREDCDLLAVVFDGVDKLQHICWRFIEPSLSKSAATPWERRIVELCREYFCRLDQILRELVAAAGVSARVFMASDHGFGPTQELFYVNVWLEREGYLKWLPGVPQDLEGKVMLDGTKNPGSMFDWSATRACSLGSGSNGIFINLAREPGSAGIDPVDYESFRDGLAQKLLGFKNPLTNAPVVKRVWTREEAFGKGRAPEAPDLTLELCDGGFVSLLNAPQPWRRREHVVGTHLPDGIFIAGGPGISRGVVLEDLSILDVAPTVLCSMGLPIPSDLEGHLSPGLFEPEFLNRNRPGAASLGPTSDPAMARYEQAATDDARAILDDELIRDRLRALGYL